MFRRSNRRWIILAGPVRATVAITVGDQTVIRQITNRRTQDRHARADNLVNQFALDTIENEAHRQRDRLLRARGQRAARGVEQTGIRLPIEARVQTKRSGRVDVLNRGDLNRGGERLAEILGDLQIANLDIAKILNDQRETRLVFEPVASIHDIDIDQIELIEVFCQAERRLLAVFDRRRIILPGFVRITVAITVGNESVIREVRRVAIGHAVTLDVATGDRLVPMDATRRARNETQVKAQNNALANREATARGRIQ